MKNNLTYDTSEAIPWATEPLTLLTKLLISHLLRSGQINSFWWWQVEMLKPLGQGHLETEPEVPAYFKKGLSLPLFLYFCLFYISQLIDKFLLMLGFELRIFGVGSDCSANCATTTAQVPAYLTYPWPNGSLVTSVNESTKPRCQGRFACWQVVQNFVEFCFSVGCNEFKFSFCGWKFNLARTCSAGGDAIFQLSRLPPPLPEKLINFVVNLNYASLQLWWSFDSWDGPPISGNV